MRTTTAKTIVLVLVISIILGSVFFAFTSFRFFNIQEVCVENVGNVSKTSSDISRIIQPMKGCNIFSVNLKKTAAQIKENKTVSEVSIRRWFPNKVIVRIEYFDYLAKIHDGNNFYMASSSSLLPVSADTFDSFSEILEMKIDSTYCSFLSKWAYDEGFFQAVSLVGSLRINLINYVKYDNNNGNGFGRLIFKLDALNVELYVNELVSEQRLNEAIDIIKGAVSVPGTLVRYDLYSNSLIRRN